ncbi:MmcQ/YjbR family DNA-binding protein [Marinicrinis sediminis]|uniref:MmcQ/YjbR family DNA-binding protein n=1 Tax=Marinicrinis sediminis TaxID=1652465 RepID=A0ABW5RC60_9BACL
MIRHEDIQQYVSTKPGFEVKTPFDPDLPVLYVGSKMFAILGMTEGEESVSLKCDPEEAFMLRQQYPGVVLPGYHLNKRHWNTVRLTGVVPDEELWKMVDDSYMLVYSKLPKKERDAIT